MNQIVTKNRDGFDQYSTDIVGDLIRKRKGPDFYRAGTPLDMEASFIALMPSMRMGDVLWQDSKIADLIADYVSTIGVPKSVRDGGYSPYSSVLLLDQDGLICTFSGSSWGARSALASLIPQYKLQGNRAFPVIQFGSKARNNQFGTIDPVLKIIGWEAASKFVAITGEESEPLAIAPPEEPKTETRTPKKRSPAEIIDDSSHSEIRKFTGPVFKHQAASFTCVESVNV